MAGTFFQFQQVTHLTGAVAKIAAQAFSRVIAQ